MRQLTRLGRALGSAALATGLTSAAGATEIVIGRWIPEHNILEPQPPGPTANVAVSREDIVIFATVQNLKPLTDEQTGAIFATPLGTNNQPNGGQESGIVMHSLNGSQGGGLSESAASGGVFSGLGGSIAGNVTGVVGNALSGLAGTIGAVTAPH